MRSSFHPSYTVLTGNAAISKNKGTSLGNFVSNFGQFFADICYVSGCFDCLTDRLIDCLTDHSDDVAVWCTGRSSSTTTTTTRSSPSTVSYTQSSSCPTCTRNDLTPPTSVSSTASAQNGCGGDGGDSTPVIIAAIVVVGLVACVIVVAVVLLLPFSPQFTATPANRRRRRDSRVFDFIQCQQQQRLGQQRVPSVS